MPPGSALADPVSADEPQARRLPVPRGPGRVAPVRCRRPQV